MIIVPPMIISINKLTLDLRGKMPPRVFSSARRAGTLAV